MLPSGVTMTRLQSESSSDFASHLNINMLRDMEVEAYELYSSDGKIKACT